MTKTRVVWRVWAGICILALSACASQVTRSDAPTAAKEPIRALSSFEVTMSPAGSAQLAENLKFDVEALRAMIQRTLEARKMLAADGDFQMTVLVEDIRVRSTFNAIMWGFMAGDDHLNGTVTLRRGEGNALGSFGVKTSWALGGFAGGQDSARLSWLYEEFAKKLADELIARRDAPR